MCCQSELGVQDTCPCFRWHQDEEEERDEQGQCVAVCSRAGDALPDLAATVATQQTSPSATNPSWKKGAPS